MQIYGEIKEINDRINELIENMNHKKYGTYLIVKKKLNKSFKGIYMAITETVSEKDIKKLNKLLRCIYQIRQESKEKLEKYFDNDGILNFMDELTLAIDNISHDKNIRNYMDMYGNMSIKVPPKV